MRQSGFTMVELIVTMIIIGIMAIAVVPRMDMLKGYDEVGYRDKVRSTLEYARKAAVAARRNVQVTIAANGMTVEMQQQTPEGEGTAAWLPVTLPGTSSHSFAAPSGVTLTSTLSPIVFGALGRPSAGAVLTVSGTSITVEAETGYVH